MACFKVRYFGPLRLITNKSEEVIEIFPETTVKELLKRLAGVYGSPFEKEIFENEEGKLRGDFVVSINGIIKPPSELFGTKIYSDDTITIFPIFLGGG